MHLISSCRFQRHGNFSSLRSGETKPALLNVKMKLIFFLYQNTFFVSTLGSEKLSHSFLQGPEFMNSKN